MNTKHFKIRWAIPLLGCALVAGGFVARNAYLDVDRATQSEQAFAATLERLHADYSVSYALKKLHEGQVDAAVRHLDLLLCEDILQVQAGLAAADGRKVAYARHAFARIDQQRPRNPTVASDADPELSNDQIAAERILADAATRETESDAGLAAAP